MGAREDLEPPPREAMPSPRRRATESGVLTIRPGASEEIKPDPVSWSLIGEWSMKETRRPDTLAEKTSEIRK